MSFQARFQKFCKDNDVSASEWERAKTNEFSRWTDQDLMNVLEHISPIVRRKGNFDNICGPTYNILEGIPWKYRILYGACIQLIKASLTFAQILVVGILVVNRRFSRDTLERLYWPSRVISTVVQEVFVKPPETLVQQSIVERKALCVNREGRFKLIGDGDKEHYAVFSYVWSEVFGWNDGSKWGAVDISVRRKGIPLTHLCRLFDVCCQAKAYTQPDDELVSLEILEREYDYEWMWLDKVAIPEVLEDMSGPEQQRTRHLQTGVLNNLRAIYQNAGRVTVSDFLVRRLKSGSLLDCAVALSLGRWMLRLWTLVESRLARKIVIRTADSYFDLDEIYVWLSKMTENQDSKYANLLARVTYLRPTPVGAIRRYFVTAEDGETDRAGNEIHFLRDIMRCTEWRVTNVKMDNGKILFPLLDIEWVEGWDAGHAFEVIKTRIPEHASQIDIYHDSRRHALEKRDMVVGKSWRLAVLNTQRAEGYW